MTSEELAKLKGECGEEIYNLTAFLPEKAVFRQRAWHYTHNCLTIPKCKTCQIVECKWSNQLKNYRTYCGSKCAHADIQVREKIKNTCLTKFNFPSNLQSQESKTKYKQTMIKRYGETNPFKVEKIKEKIKQTNLVKYGVDNPAKNQEVKAKADATHQNRYNRKRQSQQHIPLDVINLKNNRDQMLQWYKEDKLSIHEIAERLQVNHSQLCFHFKENLNIDISRAIVSSYERKIRTFIEGCYTGEIVYNDRTIIKPKELDIVFPEKKLAIELHGLAWHSETRGKEAKYHFNKMNLCKERGYRLVQITDVELNTQPNIVWSRIGNLLGASKTIHARQCEVKEISQNEASDFLDKTHIQKSCVSALRLGLFYKNDLTAVMTFGKPRFSHKFQYELLRYSNTLGVSVVGGASKLFRYFIKQTSPTSIISYCDLRWNTGRLYELLGFVRTRETGPNYWYTHKYGTLENRMKYQKHKLRNLLPIFNPDISEWENMKNNGFDRFWDCGNAVFEWHFRG